MSCFNLLHTPCCSIFPKTNTNLADHATTVQALFVYINLNTYINKLKLVCRIEYLWTFDHVDLMTFYDSLPFLSQWENYCLFRRPRVLCEEFLFFSLHWKEGLASDGTCRVGCLHAVPLPLFPRSPNSLPMLSSPCYCYFSPAQSMHPDSSLSP